MTQQLPEIRWQFGPADVPLGEPAVLRLPQGFLFADPAETRRFLEATGNPPTGRETAIIGPLDVSWFAVFSFEPYDTLGFVRNAAPDVNAIIAALKHGNQEANAARERQGQTTLDLLDWEQRPRYDAVTKNLEWSLRTVESGGQEVANYFTYYLGRAGVVEVQLVTTPKDFNLHRVTLKQLLREFRFLPGHAYMVNEFPAWWWSMPLIPAALGILAVLVRRRKVVHAKSASLR